MDTGDTAWLLIASALVMFMTPGLALFYGGMVRAKNVLGTLMQSDVRTGSRLDSLGSHRIHARLRAGQGWPDRGPRLPGFLGRRGRAERRSRGDDPSHRVRTFQMMFAIITPALITGAFAERMKFSGYVAVHQRVAAARLRADGPLGLGARRLDP